MWFIVLHVLVLLVPYVLLHVLMLYVPFNFHVLCTQQHVPSLVPYPTWCFTCFTYCQIPRVLSALWLASFFLCILCSLYVSSALLGLLINLPHALCVLWVLTTHSVLQTFLICQFYLSFFLDHSNFALQVQIHVAMALSDVESFRGCRFSSLWINEFPVVHYMKMNEFCHGKS